MTCHLCVTLLSYSLTQLGELVIMSCHLCATFTEFGKYVKPTRLVVVYRCEAGNSLPKKRLDNA